MSRSETCQLAVRFGDPGAAPPSASRTRVDIEPGKVEQGLLKLVLTLVELIRQLMEKQAMRRIEAGTLTAPEIDRLGTTLMQLEDKIKELQKQFEIDELNINLGPLGNLL